MTDLLIVAGLVLLLTPLALIGWWLYVPVAGAVLLGCGLLRSIGEDIERRAP